GLYRYVNLVYVPAISIERLRVETAVETSHEAHASLKVRLYNPGSSKEELRFGLRVFDPQGRGIHRASRTCSPWTGEISLFELELRHPHLWSPAQPSLYRCELELIGPDTGHTSSGSNAATIVTERFGLRYFEFLPHGPFKLNGGRLLIRGTQRH